MKILYTIEQFSYKGKIMDILENESIVNLKSVEIHNIIGSFLQNVLNDFSFNKKRKKLERGNDIKTDIISWSYGKYPFGETPDYMILSFTAIVRNNHVDTIVEKICDRKYFSEHSVYNDFVGELGNCERKNEFNHYHIYTKNELMDVLNEVAQFFQNKGTEFFDKFTTDNEFFEFYCIEKKYGVYGYGSEDYKAASFFRLPSLRRILFCKLLDKNEMLDEINNFNIKCLTEGEEKYHDRIIKLYYEDIKKLEEYKNET
jgi:hypothetical protein